MWQSTLVFLPGKSHGQRSLAGCSPRGRKELDTTQWLSMHAVSRSDNRIPGEGCLFQEKWEETLVLLEVKNTHSCVIDLQTLPPFHSSISCASHHKYLSACLGNACAWLGVRGAVSSTRTRVPLTALLFTSVS